MTQVAPMTLATATLDGKWPFSYPVAEQESVRAILGGAWEHDDLPDYPAVRRVLIVGAGTGASACWLYKRYRQDVYVTCIEPEPTLAAICEKNLPPGGALGNGRALGLDSDLFFVDAKGEEAYVVNTYEPLARVGVVMVEWYSELGRRAVEQACLDAGLRLFKNTQENVSRGRQIWIRSQAVWRHGRYGMP